MLAVGVGILHPAPAMYYWYIYDTEEPSMSPVARSDRSYRSWEAALEAGNQALATRSHLAAGW